MAAENNESSRQGEAEPLSPPVAPEPKSIFREELNRIIQMRISQTLEDNTDQQLQPESTFVIALSGSEENIENMLHEAEKNGVKSFFLLNTTTTQSNQSV
ncbi:hypothetical protein KR215_000592 [Drosophila sulfurigaster]|nr:hypothetical protein KR215_000592 [Drosophila sulfurigaster]